MNNIHRLLQRQIRRHLEQPDKIDPTFRLLLDAISAHYHETDRERELLQNALVVNSSELTEVNEQLRIQNRRFMHSMLNTLSEGVCAIDMYGQIIFMNDSAAQLLARNREEMIGCIFLDLVHHSCPDGKRHKPSECPLADSGENGVPAAGEEYFIHQDGHLIPVAYRSNPLMQDGERTGSVVTYHDITERLKSEDMIMQLAFYDPLTDLPNRRLLMDRLNHAMSTSSRNRKYGAIIFVDLDRFKIINDTLGHEHGDAVLKEVSARLKVLLRDADTVARLGGDEFVIIVEELDEDKNNAADNARIIGDKVLSALRKPFNLKGEEHTCTASVGIVTFLGHEVTLDEIMKRSDLAMYDAKNIGRNTSCFYDPVMQAEFNRRARLESDLRSAIEEDQLRLYYQKIVNDKGIINGAEVLLRWDRPGHGIVSPQEFIPLAEQTGLIIPVGQWVLNEACRQLVKWKDYSETRDIVLSVNVSIKEFRQDDFVERLVSVIHETGVNPALLDLEITESMLLVDIEDIIQKIVNLTRLGMRFSLDDFGTGYSSLSYLKSLPLHKLKIDKSFINDIEFDNNDAALVKTIIQIGHTLGMGVIAEGVETAAQREMLISLGCTNFQGYLFGKPVPVKDFQKELLSADNLIMQQI